MTLSSLMVIHFITLILQNNFHNSLKILHLLYAEAETQDY